MEGSECLGWILDCWLGGEVWDGCWVFGCGLGSEMQGFWRLEGGWLLGEGSRNFWEGEGKMEVLSLVLSGSLNLPKRWRRRRRGGEGEGEGIDFNWRGALE